MIKKLHLKSWLLLLCMIVGAGTAWADEYNVTYSYADLKDMLQGDFADANSYWKVPATAGKTATIAIPITNQPTSDITITLNIATFGSGDNPSSLNTTITAVGTETESNWSGSNVSSYPTSSTYVNGVMTISKPSNPTTLSGLTITMGVNTGVKIFRLKSVTISYTSSSGIPTVATPTFSPAAGEVFAGTEVSISCSTTGASIYYTTNGNEPSALEGTLYEEPIEINEATTIKAIAVKDGAEDSEVATAEYTIRQGVSGYNIDFESDFDSYIDWKFTNAVKSSSEISAHGGTYYATTGGKASASFQTKEKVAYPDVFTCYISKTSTNTTSSNWKIQVSSDGTNWTEVSTHSATNMSKGEWVEFTGDIKTAGYTNVFVRLYYDGSTAVRAVDDISLTTYTPAAVEAPSIVVPEEFTFSTTATITCVTEGATIYYSFGNATWTQYTEPLTITETKTIYAKAVKGNDESTVAQATTTKILATPEVTISATTINIGQTATVSTNGPAVTLSTSNAAIASVDGTIVTGVAEGEATITATWVANSDYSAGTKDFTVIITDPNKPGASAENPYTVAQAIEVINGLEDGAMTANEVYVSGTVTQVDEVNTTYNNATYWISNDGGTTKLEVFRGKYINNTNFESEDQIIVNDQVVVYGKLQKYVKDDVVTPEIASGNYIVTFNRPQHVVTFSVNGEETTAEVPEGRAIEFPSDPDDIYGKTFVGWIRSTIDGETNTAPEFVTSATMGTEDVMFYAVFANEIPGDVTEITDVLTRTTTGVTGTSYSSWSGKTLNSSAIYAGDSAGGNSSIQLRSTDNSGIITTKSGGKLKKIVVDWNDNTTDGRQLWILGKNTKYSSAKELYSIDTRGEDVGIVDKGTTELSVVGDYEYLGIRSKNGALYLNSISITWEGETAATYSEYCTTVSPENITVTISDKATGADGAYYSSVYYRNKALQVPEGVECQTYKMIDGALTISKTYAAGDVVPKGEAVVIKTSTFGNVVFSVSTTSEAKDAYSQLLGVDEATTITETGYKYYKLTLNSAGDDRTAGFYWDKNSNEGTKINAAAHKCYLRVPAAEVEAKSAFVFGEETAGIGQVEIDQTSNAAIYNLSGQRVNKAQKGIYIVNGKKVVIR